MEGWQQSQIFIAEGRLFQSQGSKRSYVMMRKEGENSVFVFRFWKSVLFPLAISFLFLTNPFFRQGIQVQVADRHFSVRLEILYCSCRTTQIWRDKTKSGTKQNRILPLPFFVPGFLGFISIFYCFFSAE